MICPSPECKLAFPDDVLVNANLEVWDQLQAARKQHIQRQAKMLAEKEMREEQAAKQAKQAALTKQERELEEDRRYIEEEILNLVRVAANATPSQPPSRRRPLARPTLGLGLGPWALGPWAVGLGLGVSPPQALTAIALASTCLTPGTTIHRLHPAPAGLPEVQEGVRRLGGVHGTDVH